MKQFFLVLMLVAAGAVHAQSDGLSSERKLVPPELQDDIWALDFTYTGWNQGSNRPVGTGFPYSIGLNYHFELNFSAKKKWAAALGLGYRYSMLSHRDHVVIDSFDNVSAFGPVGDLDYSRLNMHELRLPFELRFKGVKGFKFYAGYELGLIVGMRNNSKLNGEKHSIVLRDFSNRLQHGPYFRIGFKDVFLFGGMNISSLFKANENSSMELYRIGISLGG